MAERAIPVSDCFEISQAYLVRVARAKDIFEIQLATVQAERTLFAGVVVMTKPWELLELLQCGGENEGVSLDLLVYERHSGSFCLEGHFVMALQRYRCSNGKLLRMLCGIKRIQSV